MYVYIYERIQCNTKYIIRMVPTAYAPPSKYIREYISIFIDYWNYLLNLSSSIPHCYLHY